MVPKFIRDTVLTESKLDRSDGKYIVRGLFQKCDTKNANGRVYKKKLWENILSSPEITQSLKDRTMLGELGHPEIVETTLTNVSHIVTKLELKPNGDVYGEAEILDTPSGRILKTLYDAGVKIGISSRGYIPEGSDLIREGDHYIVPDDFQLVGFDFVLTPSTYGAHPTLAENQRRELVKALNEGKTKIEPKLYNYLQDMSKRSIIESVSPLTYKSNKLIIKFNKIKEDKLNSIMETLKEKYPNVTVSALPVYNSLEIKSDLSESELNIFSAKVNRFIKRISPKCTPSNLVLDLDGKLIDISESLFRKSNAIKKEVSKLPKESKYVTKLESVVEELRDRYLLSEKVIESLKNQNDLSIDVIKDLKNRYLTAEEVIKEFREYSIALEETLAETVNLYKLSEEVIEDLAKRYTLSEKVIEDLRDRYLTSEEALKTLVGRHKLAEGIIKNLAKRYKLAEGVIAELRDRYTLSESVISELRGIIKEEKGETEIKESVKSRRKSRTSLSEYLSEQAEKYNISLKEARRIFERAKEDKETFEFILSEKFSAISNNYAEFPYGKRKNVVFEEQEETSFEPRPEDKLAHIISKVF